MSFHTLVNDRKKPIIGIIGGAGPDAAVNFHSKLLKAMKKILSAKTDVEHYRVILDNNVEVNEHCTYSKDEKLFPQGYIQSALLLKKMGASIITIPCNSAHIYYPEIKKEVSPILLVDMIEKTCQFLRKACSNYAEPIGVLAINSTISNHIYTTPLKHMGLKVLVPEKKIQQKVLQAIIAIKAGIYSENFTIQCLDKNGDPQKASHIRILDNSQEGENIQRVEAPIRLIEEAIMHLSKKGARFIILGCSELSIIAKDINKMDNVFIVDAIDILAEETIKIAQNISAIENN